MEEAPHQGSSPQIYLPKIIKIFKFEIFQSAMFSSEVCNYTDIFPRLMALEPGLNPPKTFYSDSEQGILVMEDLRREGYKMVNVVQGK